MTAVDENKLSSAGSGNFHCDDLDVLLGATDWRRAHGRKLLAALIADERIDVAFRAGLLLSLGDQR